MARTRIWGTALVVGALLAFATPAQAQKTTTHWTIDKDTIRLVKVGDQFTFRGTFESFDDNNRVRGQVTGNTDGVGTLTVRWKFRDGTTQLVTPTPTGTNHAVNVLSNATKTVVSVTVRYARNGTSQSQTHLVGDAPDSLGTCERLDADKGFLGSGGSTNLSVSITWACLNSASEITGRFQGTFRTVAGPTQSVSVRINHSDGTQRVYSTSTSQAQTLTLDFVSDTGKRARSMSITFNNGVNPPTISFGYEFGDTPD